MKNILLVLILGLAAGAMGCQRISAREVLPEYVKKKEAAAAAAQGELSEPLSTNPPTFFPGQKID